MNAKTNILNRLLAAQTTDTMSGDLPSVNRASATAEKHLEQQIKQFSDNLLAAHAQVIEAKDEDWWRILITLCRENDCRKLWLNPRLNFVNEHLSAEINLINFAGSFVENKQFIFKQLDAACSLAEAIISETGTVVLRPSSEEPRSMSLVPPIHFVIAEKKQCYANLAEYFAANLTATANTPMPTNLLFISGPSKTADIQQTLAYGAHGPKQLIVILVDSVR